MTRYPKNGKGSKWTLLELKSIPREWSGDTLSDGDGLTGEVRIAEDGAVSIRFKYAFKWDSKVHWHQCGTWPTSPLDSIRRSRDEARLLLKDGVNPNDKKKAQKIEAQAEIEAAIARAKQEEQKNLTFLDMYHAWITDGVSRKDGNAEIKRSFGKDVLPLIDKKKITEISEHDLRTLLRKMVARKVSRLAVCTYHDLVQMFSWAEKRKPWRQLLVEGNPMDLIEISKIVPPNFDLRGERSRILSSDELRELRDIFDTMEDEYDAAAVGVKLQTRRPFKKESQIAIWICLATLCRIGELLMTKWEDIDLDMGIWEIPKENVKGTAMEQNTHLIALSSFALTQFKALHELTGDSPYCFPSRNNPKAHVCVKSVSKQVGDRQFRFKTRTVQLKNRRNDNSLVLGNGKKGDWTPHDMRRTGATMMQRLKVPLDVIDRCQNHVIAGSRVRRHYMHYEYLEETTDAWKKLGAELEAILKASSVTT